LDDRVVVLGATGYVGRAVVDALHATGRPAVMVARRRPSAVPPGAAFVACDASDARQLALAVGEAGSVVNAMAGSPSAMVRGARNLAAIVEQGAGGARIVHVSSLAVFGQAIGTLDETTPPLPARRHAYAVGKLACEEILRRAAAIVVRPGCIYGAGAPIWCDRIGRLLLGGRLGWLGRGGQGWCNVVHVDDVARSIVRALDARLDDSDIHHVVAQERLSWNEYFGRFATQLGIALPRIGSARLQAEILLVSPFLHLCRGAADIVTPSMARAFRCPALPVARRPLLAPHEFHPLDDGLAEAAAALQRQRVGEVAPHRVFAAAAP
jgi:nucleoside-diphosphate-sugar epimerase